MIIKTNNGKEEVVRIHVYLNTMCNLKCSYCYMRNGTSWGRITKKDYLEDLILKLKDINIQIDLILLGGEPTYYQSLDYFLDKIKDISNIRSIYILSNGTRSFTYYKKLLDTFQQVNLYLTYHSTEYDKSKFISNVEQLDPRRIYINILIDDIKFDYDYILSKLNHFMIYGTYLYDMQNNCSTDVDYLEFLVKYKSNFKRYISIDNKLYSDIEVLLNHMNQIKNIRCYNNNLYCNLHEDNLNFYQNCSDIVKNIDDINNLDFNILCPLDTCSCQGMLSDYKESNE